MITGYSIERRYEAWFRRNPVLRTIHHKVKNIELAMDVPKRRYKHSGQYHDPYQMLRSLVYSARVATSTTEFEPKDVIEYICMATECPSEEARQRIQTGTSLIKHDFPLFFAGREFTEAIMNSGLPDEVNIQHLIDHLPFPAFSIMLPKAMVRQHGEYVRAITISSIDFAYEFNGHRSTRRLDTGKMIVFNLHTAFDQKSDPDGTWIEDRYSTALLFCSDEKQTVTLNEFTDAEKMAVGMLMAMIERPEYIERIGRKVSFHKKSKSEVWTPNYIGRKYVVKRIAGPTATGTGVSRRMHWRRGHFRNQRYGSGLEKFHTIWIEPMLVGGH